jgi:Rod binding domain-containing protein
MDSAKLILTEAFSSPIPSEKINKTGVASDAEKKQFAMDFESVFIGKLLDEMKKSIGDWGLEKDAASEQIDGIFWLYLARDLGNSGGLGMWKDIYQSMNDSGHDNTATKLLDANL